MLGCQPRPLYLALLASALFAVATASIAQPLRLHVEPGLEATAAALIDAYGGDAELVAADADLRLSFGSPVWDDALSVAPTPESVLTRLGGSADAFAFQRVATSAAGQRALTEAGLLPATVTVRDQEGRTVVIPQPVERVYSAYGVATYLVYVLGAGDRLVAGNFLGARDPDGAAAMERIDPAFPDRNVTTPQDTTNVEFVASLASDLVLSGGSGEWAAAVEAIGIPVLGFAGESPELLRESLRIAGQALGPNAMARAEAWITYYDQVLAAVESALSGIESRPTVLFTGTNRTRVASGVMYQSTLIALAGGRSVTAHLTGGWNDIDIEQVLTWNPDTILVPPYGQTSVAAVVEDPEWQLLDAVRAASVYRVPKVVAPWDTPVPDSVLAVVWLAETLHGAQTGLDCAAETRFFYQRFYDYDLRDEEIAALCRP